MLRRRATLACIPLLLLAGTPAAAQDSDPALAPAPEAAPTASGLPSEGAEDLSAATSQPGSPNQPAWNLLSTLRGAELRGEGGEETGELLDVLVDGAGMVRGLVVDTAGLGGGSRLLETTALPPPQDGGLILALPEEQLEEFDEAAASATGLWLASDLAGAEVSGAEGDLEIADLRFATDRVDRVILDDGEFFDPARELPFSGLVLSGSAEEPEIALSEEGQRRLSGMVEID